MSGALIAETAHLRNQMTAFLNFCRLEKGLSANSIEAYSTDLAKFSDFPRDSLRQSPAGPDAEACGHYLDHLYQSGSEPPVHRPAHLTTLRNFYGFLLREGLIATDPTRAPGRPAAMAEPSLSF